MTVQLDHPQSVRRDEEVADAVARARDEYVVCRAETAECTCPDACERDHGND